jgi:uncharacterized protein (UPF0332 family)
MKIRYKRPDRKNALSIVESANNEIKFTLSLKISEEAGPTIIRNVYESFRMLGDALLVSKGIESQDHLMPINELMKLRVKTRRPINIVDNLRRLKHNINYYGYKPRLSEIEDTISIAKTCFKPLYNEVKKII